DICGNSVLELYVDVGNVTDRSSGWCPPVDRLNRVGAVRRNAEIGDDHTRRLQARAAALELAGKHRNVDRRRTGARRDAGRGHHEARPDGATATRGVGRQRVGDGQLVAGQARTREGLERIVDQGEIGRAHV